MTPSDASTVAAPDAGTSADPLDSLFEGVLDAQAPEQNFDLPKGRQLGESADIEPVAAPVAKVTTPAAIADPNEVEVEPEEAEVGTPYAIGKDGRVRDAHGRYQKKVESPPPEPVATTEKIKDGAPTQSAPFRYRAMGETHEPKGITIDPEKGSLTVDAESVPLIREALNALKVRDVQHIPTIQRTMTENASLKAQLAERDTRSSAAEAQAKALMASLEDALTTADETLAVEKFFKMRDDLPGLKTKAEVEYWKAQAQRTTTHAVPAAAPPKVEAPQESHGLPSQDEALGNARELLASVRIEHQYRDLTDKDWQQFDADVARKPMAYVRRATDKDVKEYGVTPGQPVFDTDLILDDIAQYATRLREQRAAALKREQLAATNARTTQATIATPPAVSTSRPAKATAKVARINSKQDLEDYLSSDEI